MAIRQSRFIDPEGRMRMRAVLAPHNADDLGLDPRLVTFDSAWTNVLRLRANGVAAANALEARSLSYAGLPGQTGTRGVRVIPHAGVNGPWRPTLAWQRNNGGTLQQRVAGTDFGAPTVARPYVRGYGVCAVSLADDEILVSPSKASSEYCWFIFGTNPTSDEGDGPNGMGRGLHPLYGRGLFMSRPGFNHLTCSLDDMMLSTRRPCFQIAETGTVFPNTSNAGGTTWDADQIVADPFPTGPDGGSRNCAIVTLTRSYPHYPPVMAYAMAPQGQGHAHLSVFWLSANQILIAGTPAGNIGMRYAVVGTDPAYQGGLDTVTGRCRIHTEPGLGTCVTHHDVHYYTAHAGQFIFRADRLTPRFPGFGSIVTGESTGAKALPSIGIPPVGASAPFVFYLVPHGQHWWCGCGVVHSQDIYDSVTNFPMFYFRASTYNRANYWWAKESGWSSQAFGWIALMNISDFG